MRLWQQFAVTDDVGSRSETMNRADCYLCRRFTKLLRLLTVSGVVCSCSVWDNRTRGDSVVEIWSVIENWQCYWDMALVLRADSFIKNWQCHWELTVSLRADSVVESWQCHWQLTLALVLQVPQQQGGDRREQCRGGGCQTQRHGVVWAAGQDTALHRPTGERPVNVTHRSTLQRLLRHQLCLLSGVGGQELPISSKIDAM